jgi:putative ABC transport system permease protein
MREFSIRKIFGASMMHIIREMNRDYAWIVMTAFLIAAPLGWQMVSQMIAVSYPENIPTPIWPFLLTGGLMTGTVLIVITMQLGRLRSETPAETLKNE